MTGNARSPGARCLLLWVGVAALACSSKAGTSSGGANGGAGGGGGAKMTPPDGGSDGATATAPFDPLPPHVYAAKVKTLLTGLALTDDELRKVTADPKRSLGDLIDGWMGLPQWKEKTLVFFAQAFQQTQTDVNDYDEQLGFTTNPWNNLDRQRFLRAAEDSFARTAMALVEEGRPFTEVVTTERFMLNPPLMSLYAFMDAVPLNDQQRPVQAQLWLLRKFPKLQMVGFERTTVPDAATGQPIPFTDSINPDSPNFLRFHEPKPYMGMNERCKEPQTVMGVQALRFAVNYLFGGRPGCGSTDSQWTEADWSAWRWVTVRRPQANEERTVFWDLPRLRAAEVHDLVVSTPRVGFMTTMAFFANWPTNQSNSYRVTTNQALIVGLGRSFDDRSITAAVAETTSDEKHVEPGTPCHGCHMTLDPMRDFFRQSYSLYYFSQYDPAVPRVGVFSVGDTPPSNGNGIRDFAKAMAGHPRFAVAWTQKLCELANSAPCDESDPEFQRVAAAFARKFDWKTLVRELFSSPLVTFAEPTKTAEANGVVISIARREALCASLEHRLGLTDLCSLRGPLPMGAGGMGVMQIRNRARNLALAIPGAGYARGDTGSLLPHDPNLFFSAATENLCLLLGQRLVDQPAGQNLFVSARRKESFANMTSVLMGLPPGDPRAAGMTGVLEDHFAEAMQAGANAREAMQSAFMLACSAPPGVSIGL